MGVSFLVFCQAPYSSTGVVEGPKHFVDMFSVECEQIIQL